MCELNHHQINRKKDIYKNITVYKQIFKSSSVKLNQRTAKYLYILKSYLHSSVVIIMQVSFFRSDAEGSK